MPNAMMAREVLRGGSMRLHCNSGPSCIGQSERIWVFSDANGERMSVTAP